MKRFDRLIIELDSGNSEVHIEKLRERDQPAGVYRHTLRLTQGAECWSLVSSSGDEPEPPRTARYVRDPGSNRFRDLRNCDAVELDGFTVRYVCSPPGWQGAARPSTGVEQLATEVSRAERRVLRELVHSRRIRNGVVATRSNRELADRLALSVNTVKTHLKCLYAKFDLRHLPAGQRRAALAELASSITVCEEVCSCDKSGLVG